jgi:hypothetical protein
MVGAKTPKVCDSQNPESSATTTGTIGHNVTPKLLLDGVALCQRGRASVVDGRLGSGFIHVKAQTATNCEF